jgi:hypothetical protein
MFFSVLEQHVSTLIELFSGPSKKIYAYLEMLKCAVVSQKLTFLIKLCIKCVCVCVLNVQSRYLFLSFRNTYPDCTLKTQGYMHFIHSFINNISLKMIL